MGISKGKGQVKGKYKAGEFPPPPDKGDRRPCFERKRSVIHLLAYALDVAYCRRKQNISLGTYCLL